MGVLGLTATLALTVAGVAGAGLDIAAPASASPESDDHECLVAPYLSQCLGAPIGVPTSPSDPSCAMSPGDAVCSGGPFAAPAAPPPIGSDLPGSMMPDGMPFGSGPPPGMTGMPGSIPGMPGI